MLTERIGGKPAGDLILPVALPLLGVGVALLVRAHRRSGDAMAGRLTDAEGASRADVRRELSRERRRIAVRVEELVRRDIAEIDALAAAAVHAVAARDQAGSAEALRAVEAIASEAIGELRELLGAVDPRVEGQPASAPLGDLHQEVGRLRAGGVGIDLVERGDGRLTTPGALRSAARVVRDVLGDDADAAGPVSVTVVHRPGWVLLRLSGRGRRPGALADPRTVVSVREQVRLHGGSMTAAGGALRWRVRAALPSGPADGDGPLRWETAQVDAALAAITSAIVLFDVTVLPVERPGASAVIGIATAALPLAVRRRAPLLTCTAAAGGMLAGKALGVFPPGPVAPYLIVTIVPIAAAAHATTAGRALTGVAVITAAAVAVTAPQARSRGRPTSADLAVLVAYSGLVGAAAWYARHHHGRALALAADEEHVRRRHTSLVQRVVEDARRRAACDLHDVVAHGVTLCSVLAGTARVQASASEWTAAEHAAGALVDSARQTVAELERFVAALALDRDAAAEEGIGDLLALVERVRSAGQEVDLVVDVDGDVSPPAAACAYRLVQEALTNARRHAGAPHVRVEVRRTGDVLAVEVVTGAPRAPGSGHGSGRGLDGIRRRAAALGGRAEAGPLPGGGFRTAVRLPV